MRQPKRWLQPKQYAALKMLAEKPVTRAEAADLKRSAGGKRVRLTPYDQLVRKGYAMFDHMASKPYWVITPAGRAQLERVANLPRLPKYAGGEEGYFRPKKAPEPLQEAGKDTSTSGTTVESVLIRPCAVVEVMVTVRVPVTMLLDGRRLDPQRVADEVNTRLKAEGCNRFLAGCTIERVLGEAGNVLVEGLRA
jgi:hypothetical protein